MAKDKGDPAAKAERMKKEADRQYKESGGKDKDAGAASKILGHFLGRHSGKN